MRCTLCPVHELTRETEIDFGKCDSYTRCCRNFATTHTVGVAEILQSLIHWIRNSAAIYTLGVVEIL